jgi:hypothetical protein
VETSRANAVQTVRDPLKEGHHFDQSLGGIAGMFENIRSNTQACASTCCVEQTLM